MATALQRILDRKGGPCRANEKRCTGTGGVPIQPPVEPASSERWVSALWPVVAQAAAAAAQAAAAAAQAAPAPPAGGSVEEEPVQGLAVVVAAPAQAVGAAAEEPVQGLVVVVVEPVQVVVQ